jgi:hypothetical protein
VFPRGKHPSLNAITVDEVVKTWFERMKTKIIGGMKGEGRGG